MSESTTQPQSDAPSDTQPAISEQLLSEESPPARWRLSRSALLLVGVPLAGALLVWLAISTLGGKPTTPPASVTIQPAAEPAPATESPAAIEAGVANSAEAEPEPQPTAEPQPPPQPEPETVVSEPPQRSDAPPSASNEVIPDVPQSALDTIRGTVRVSVRVIVDKQGNVMDATAQDGGPSRYFERLAVAASRKWTFPPENLEERTMLVKFNFTREGVTASAMPADPLQ